MKYRIERQVTSANGYQTFEVEADSREEAKQLFLDEKSEMVESEVEVEDLECLDQINFDREMHEA